MTVSPQGMSVQALYRAYRDGALIVNRQYQRKLVWTVAEKQKLIDSVLKDYPLPLFLLAEISAENSHSRLEVIDGMQRLNAIFSFIEHGFTWNDRCFDLSEFARARQAAAAGAFAALPEDTLRLSAKECANFLDYQLAVTVFPGEQEARITDVFGRINSGGRQLSDQERRQAGVLSPFAEMVRTLSAEIRGDVSREVLLLSEMPEISIETTRNAHGYSLKAEDIFWCYQGILRTGDLRESDDEQAIADICASILYEEPVTATGEFLDRLYSKDHEDYVKVNTLLNSYGRDRLTHEVKAVFSAIRAAIEESDQSRFAFRKLVYPKPTSNAQKSPFFAVFMAFYELMFREGMAPSNNNRIFLSLNDLAKKISVGMKHTKADDRQDNIKVTKGLIRDQFSKADVLTLSHGPGMIFDFENSLRRSRTETARYEFKQGLLRLDSQRGQDPAILQTIIETLAAISNCGPDADGYLYIGIADKDADASRIEVLDDLEAVKFDQLKIVGVEREAKLLGIKIEDYVRKISDAVANSQLPEPLRTQILTQMDVITYKGAQIVRITVRRQTTPTFLGDDCFIRANSATVKATGPQIAAVSNLFR